MDPPPPPPVIPGAVSTATMDTGYQAHMMIFGSGGDRFFSDWANPQGFAGESTAVTTAYRDKSTGAKQAGTFRIYEYTLALDPTKLVKSLILLKNANVALLAIDLLP